MLGKLASQKADAIVDPAGYQAYVAEREQAFRDNLAKQQKLSTGGNEGN